MGCGAKDASTVGTITPVDDHVSSAKRNGDGLVGDISLPGGDKRALVRLRVGEGED